jgi:predicted dehydrogenase
MRDACARHGVKFNYGTQRRYMPLYHKVRAMIEAGELGNVNAIIGHVGASAAQWGHTHATDMLLFLAGDPDVEFAQGTIVAKDEDWEGDRLNIDPAVPSAYFRFANGIHAYLVAAGGYEFEVSGSKGKVKTLNNGVLAEWRQVTPPHNILESAPFPEVECQSGTLMAIQDIVEALDTGRETLGNIHVAHRSQEMILAVVESSRRGGQRVSLPLDNRNLYVANKGW